MSTIPGNRAGILAGITLALLINSAGPLHAEAAAQAMGSDPYC